MEPGRGKPCAARLKLGAEQEVFMMTISWVDKQTGQVNQFELVQHTFINEDTGEMHCISCGASEHTVRNTGRRFDVKVRQDDAFERFTEKHLHGADLTVVRN